MRRWLAVVAVIFVVASSVPLPMGGVATVDAAQPDFDWVPSEHVTTSGKAVNPSDPPKAKLQDYAGGGGPPPAVLRSLPPSATTEIVASKHADTTELEYALTTDGELALVITDDANHGERTIGVPAAVLEDVVGERPDFAYGLHEDGDDWISAVSYDQHNGRDYAFFDVNSFSTNTVTWSGQFTIEGEPATDGTKYTYDQQESINSLTINVTGHTATEWDNETDNVAASRSIHTDDTDFGLATLSGNGSVENSGQAADVKLVTVPQSSTTFTATGAEQTLDIPVGVTNVDVELWGAQGQDGKKSGGQGGHVAGTLNVDERETLRVYVGERTGFNGGGNGGKSAGSGGGATDIRQGGSALADRVAVAGGGGGGGFWESGDNGEATAGGAGGADTGGNAADLGGANGGNGGTQSAGGSGGSAAGAGDPGSDGSLGSGGAGGGLTANNDLDYGGGGGGGGYYGGGGGAAYDGGHEGAGGGGGSSYDDGLATVSTYEQGVWTGDGKATISWDGDPSSTYLSPNHTVANSDTAYVDLTGVNNAAVTVTVETSDGSGWETINQTTGITTVGNHTFTWPTETNSTIRLNVTASDQAGVSNVTIADERITGGATPSVAPAGNLQPTGAGATGNATLTVTGVADGNANSPGDVTATASDGSTVSFTNLGTSTVTKEIDLTTAATQLDFSFTEGTVLYWLNFTERTQTVDPAVEVNGNSASHNGALADGTRVTLSSNTAWVNTAGTNRVNVTVGDGSLTADAPTPSVDLYYSHEGQDDSEVSYTGEKWTESYNISKTYAKDAPSSNVTIPFQGSVVRIRTIEKKVNSGAWSTVASADYSLSGTTLDVDLGSVSANDKVYVRVDGSKVNPNNADITVLEPTVLGDALDTSVRLDTWNSDSYIALGGTEDGAKVHYASTESWSNDAEYVRFTAGGAQELYLPNAGAGDDFRVKTHPVEVSPVTGDVEIELSTINTGEPIFEVREGSSVEDDVDYTFTDAISGTDYVLYSTTEGTSRGSATASSPITIGDDDSAETLQFQIDTGTGGGTGGGGGGGAGGGTGGTTVVNQQVGGVPAWAFIAGVLLLGLAYVSFRREPSGEEGGLLDRGLDALGAFGRFALTNRATQLGIGLLAVVALVQTGALPITFVQVVGFLAVPPAVWWIMRRTGNMDRRVLAGVTAIALVFAAESLSPGALLGPIGENLGAVIQTVGPLLAIGALWLIWRWTRDDRPTVPGGGGGTVLIPARVQRSEEDDR